MRHWHWFLLSMLLVPMGATMAGLVQAFAYPVTAIFSKGNGFIWYFIYIAFVQVVSVLWVLLQRNALGGGDFMNFIGSLPVPAGVRLSVNLTVLLVANSILLIAFFSAILVSLNPFGPLASFELFAVVVLFGLILTAQLSILERPLTLMISVIIADCLFAVGLTQGTGLDAWLLVLCSFGIAVIGLYLPSVPCRVTIFPKARNVTVVKWNKSHEGLSVIKIQLNALRGSYSSVLMILSMSAFVSAGSVFVMASFNFDSRSLMAALIAMDIVAFMLSGVYRILLMAHAEMEKYSASLPVGKYFWFLRDGVFVTLVGFLFLIIILTPVLINLHVSIVELVAISIAYGMLLVVLRLLLMYGGRQTTLLGFICSVLWAVSMIFAVV